MFTLEACDELVFLLQLTSNMEIKKRQDRELIKENFMISHFTLPQNAWRFFYCVNQAFFEFCQGRQE